MNSLDTIRDVVAQHVKARFGDYPVVIQESPEDPESLWVQVFAVPDAQELAVTDLILDLQETVSPDCSVLLLPMVKTLEVTRQYYPQHAPSEPIQTADFFFRFRHPRQAVDYVIASGVHAANTLQDSFVDGLGMRFYCWGGKWPKPLHPAEKLAATTDELATAA